MEIVDYTQSGFILPIVRDNVKGYASINHEFYNDVDGLDFTGHYIVYLLHPKRGSMQFMLEPDEKEKWVIPKNEVGREDDTETEDGKFKVPSRIETPPGVEQDILDEIIQAIEFRRHSAGPAVDVARN